MAFTERGLRRKMGTGFSVEPVPIGQAVIEGQYRLDRQKTFVTVRMVKHWTKLPRETVRAPSMVTFHARLVEALSNLI